MISKALGFDHKHCQTGCRMRYHLLDEFKQMPCYDSGLPGTDLSHKDQSEFLH